MMNRTTLLLKRVRLWLLRTWRRFRIIESRLKRKHPRIPRLRWLALAGLMLLSSVLPTVELLLQSRQYALSPEVRALVGAPNKNLTKKITYKAETNSWQFNKDGLPIDIGTQDADMPSVSQLKAQIGGGGENDDSLYAVNMPANGTKGVSYYDANTGLSFTLTPTFHVGDGRQVDGHLVYPSEKGSQLIYTAKNNGMKEDIILPESIGDAAEFSYKLELPETLQAKIQADGSLGVFSPNPVLFGTISGDQDKEKILSARKTAAKDHLLFVLPAPFIKQAGGKDAPSATARFQLTGDTLTVSAKGLADLNYPITVDPSVVVTSAGDFLDGNSENITTYNIDQISRSDTTGGALRAWSSTTNLPVENSTSATVTYGGYMYVIGGSSFGRNVYYAEINSNGTLGSWMTTSQSSKRRVYHGAAAWGGYVYIWGGLDKDTGSPLSLVEYAKIQSDGTLGSWQTTSSMGTAVCRAAYASSDGFLYSLGGSTTPNSECTRTSTGAISTVQYAPIKADGSIGTWSTTTSIGYGTSGQVMSGMAGTYNGYMYMLGGTNSGGGTAYSNVQYAPIQPNGTLGSWMTSTSLPSGTYDAGFGIYNSHLYVYSNQDSGSNCLYNQIYENGSPGEVWTPSVNTGGMPNTRPRGNLVFYNGRAYYIGGDSAGTGTDRVDYYEISTSMHLTYGGTTTKSYTTSRERAAAAIYGNCIYQLGGYGAGGNMYVAYTQYSMITNNGDITMDWPNQSFSTARADHAAVAYNGYLYVIGGYNGNSNAYYNTVQYTAINSDCSLAGWSATTAFDISGSARGGVTAFAYNGYMYVTGGINASGNSNSVRFAPIYSNGTIGTWSSTTNLPAAVNRHRTTVWGNRVYLLGGTQLALPNVNNGATTGSRPTGSGYDTAYYTTINEDGTLGSWQSTTSLPYDAYEFGAVAHDGYIYITGGYTSTAGGIRSLYSRAKINEDGTLGNWTTEYDISSGIASHALVASGGYIYNVGGRTDSGVTNTNRLSSVRMNPVNGVGSGKTGSWSSTSTLNTGRTYSGTTGYNGYIYTVGGSSDGGTTGRNDVEYSLISRQNGALGAFTTDSHTLNSSRVSPGVTAYNEHLYVAGGKTSSTYHGSVEYAPIGQNGALSDNFSTTTNFVTGSGSDTGRVGTCIVAMQTSNGVGRLYAIGGYDGTTYHNTVRYTLINSDGSLQGWSSGGASLTGGRADAGCFYTNGYLYVMGGRDGSTTYSDVQVGKLNSGGTIDGWAHTTSFRGGRSNFVSGFMNGFVYIYGGCTTIGCSAGYGDVQFAAVSLNGMLGSWNYRFSTDTEYTPYVTSGTAHGGYLYHIGGAGVSSNVTSYTPLQSLLRTARYSKLIDLGSYSNITSITYSSSDTYNNSSPGAPVIKFQSADVNGVFRDTTSIANLTANSSPCDTSNLAYTRYVRIVSVFDNYYRVPDDSSPATISDITINYRPSRPSPDVRLHGGKTLIDGTVSPLDTCQN